MSPEWWMVMVLLVVGRVLWWLGRPGPREARVYRVVLVVGIVAMAAVVAVHGRW